MAIVFFCQSCGARFEVEPRLSGKKGRCKRCGQTFTVPRAAELASMVAMPALPEQAVAAPPRAAAAAAAPAAAALGPEGWLAAATSNVALKPLTVDRMPAGWRPPGRPALDDSLGDSKPYALAEFRPPAARLRGSSRPAGSMTRFYRERVNDVARLFRRINEFAYLVSVPFVMLVLAGIAVRSRPLAVLGATVVVLLNVVRLGTGLANLVVIPFREGVAQGIGFLIPPFTFIYLANHWKALRKPTMRIVGPALTIGLVVVAFAFVPWLRSGEPAQGAGVAAQLKQGAASLKEGIRGEVESAGGADLGALKGRARDAMSRLGEELPTPADSGPEAGGPSPGDAAREALRGVERRVLGQTGSP